MNRFLRLPDDDRGVALVVAIAVMVIALMLSTVVVTIAVRQTRATGVDRQRGVTVNAAEAGVDASFNAIQTAGLTLPCTWPSSGTTDVRAYPDRATLASTITYYDASNAPLSCAQVQSGVVPAFANIKATSVTNTLGGGSSNGNRAMESYVSLTPVTGNGLNNAIFSNGTFTVRNNHIVRGDVGADADVYSNHDIVCPNGSNQTYEGSILSQGTITLTGQCSALGDVWAKGPLTLGHNSSTVGGRAISSTGSVSVNRPDGVTGLIMAGTTITPASCVAPKCVRNLIQAAPPYQPFPQIRRSLLGQWTSAAPAGGGYTEVTYTGGCGEAAGNWIASHASAYSTPTVITTVCQVAFKSDDITMGSNIAIFADGGFTSEGHVNFLSSTSGARRELYFIAPYDMAVCPGSDIDTDNNFSIDDDVDLLLYTPCSISVDNHNDHFGQIYAGETTSISNHYDMQFRRLPIWGVDPGSLATLAYRIDIIFKREVQP